MCVVCVCVWGGGGLDGKNRGVDRSRELVGVVSCEQGKEGLKLFAGLIGRRLVCVLDREKKLLWY